MNFNKPTEGADAQSETFTRRKNFRKLALGTAALVAAVISLPSSAIARTVVPDPAYEQRQAELEAQYFSEAVSEKLKPNEIPLMDRATEVIFRQYVQRSFGWHLAALGKESEARRAMEIAMSRENRERYLNFKTGRDGYITINKKHGFAPSSIPDDFKMVIRDGIIVQIGDIEIDYRRIGRFEKESRENEKNLLKSMMVVVTRPAEATDQDWSELEYFAIKLPRLLHTLLKAKEGYTKKEEDVLQVLNKLIPKQPKSLKALFNDTTGRIKIQFYTAIRLGGRGGEATPQGAYELVHSFLNEKGGDTYATFSNRGFVMEKIDGKWVNSDRNKNPFAELCKETYQNM